MEIRKATVDDASGITHVHSSAWKSTYTDIMPLDLIHSMNTPESIERRKVWLASKSHSFVVEDKGSILGFTVGGDCRDPHPTFQAECYAIYLLEKAQRRGAGTLLFETLCDQLKAEGHRTLCVWVLPQNPACYFYEKMGGRPYDELDDYHGGLYLPHRRYGWFW